MNIYATNKQFESGGNYILTEIIKHKDAVKMLENSEFELNDCANPDEWGIIEQVGNLELEFIPIKITKDGYKKLKVK